MPQELISLLIWIGLGIGIFVGQRRKEPASWWLIWALYCAVMITEIVDYAQH